MSLTVAQFCTHITERKLRCSTTTTTPSKKRTYYTQYSTHQLRRFCQFLLLYFIKRYIKTLREKYLVVGEYVCNRKEQNKVCVFLNMCLCDSKGNSLEVGTPLEVPKKPVHMPEVIVNITYVQCSIGAPPPTHTQFSACIWPRGVRSLQDVPLQHFCFRGGFQVLGLLGEPIGVQDTGHGLGHIVLQAKEWGK